MTVTTGGPDVASVVRALSDANVQFVVVGEPSAGGALQLVVSRHPTNLEALGRALDRLESTVRGSGVAAANAAGDVGGANDDGDPGDEEDCEPPRRVGDPFGTVTVATSGGDVDLMFGGPRRSLYAEVVLRAQERELGGLRVQWTDELPQAGPAPRVTSRVLGRRLLSLAEGLAHLMDRHDEPGSQDGEHGADG